MYKKIKLKSGLFLDRKCILKHLKQIKKRYSNKFVCYLCGILIKSKEEHILNIDQFVANYLYCTDYNDALATYKKFKTHIDSLLFWEEKQCELKHRLSRIIVEFISEAYRAAFKEIEMEILILETTIQPIQKSKLGLASDWARYFFKKVKGEKS